MGLGSHQIPKLQHVSDKYNQPISVILEENKLMYENVYANCSDVVIRPFQLKEKTDALLIYIDGLSNIQELDSLLSTLMTVSINNSLPLFQQNIAVAKVTQIKTFAEGIESISAGNPILFFNGAKEGVSLGLQEWEKRSIIEPDAERVVRGPREGFTESLGVNTSLLRRKLRTPELKMVSLQIGNYTRTSVIIAYIEGIADPHIVEQVNDRLQRIQIKGIVDSGYIQEMISDSRFSPFPQLLDTERPDNVVGSLLEGRVAVLTDGSPSVLIAPITIFSFLQAGDDYYQNFWSGTLIRWFRYIFVSFSLLLPSIYVAALTFHQEMIPSILLISIAASREHVPFPALIEALLMEVSFEVLREAGLRLPKQVGPAVGIVGALVIGEAAVQAGLVSSPMVMVVALTGISSFLIPRYSMSVSLRMLRLPLIFLSGTLGFVGIILFLCGLLIHCCSLRSFGVSYLSPMAPVNINGLKDVLGRSPLFYSELNRKEK